MGNKTQSRTKTRIQQEKRSEMTEEQQKAINDKHREYNRKKQSEMTEEHQKALNEKKNKQQCKLQENGRPTSGLRSR